MPTFRFNCQTANWLTKLDQHSEIPMYQTLHTPKINWKICFLAYHHLWLTKLLKCQTTITVQTQDWHQPIHYQHYHIQFLIGHTAPVDRITSTGSHFCCSHHRRRSHRICQCLVKRLQTTIRPAIHPSSSSYPSSSILLLLFPLPSLSTQQFSTTIPAYYTFISCHLRHQLRPRCDCFPVLSSPTVRYPRPSTVHRLRFSAAYNNLYALSFLLPPSSFSVVTPQRCDPALRTYVRAPYLFQNNSTTYIIY